jgi:hypothetical protein
MNDTKKQYYSDKFITWLQDKKVFDALGLSYEEKSMAYAVSPDRSEYDDSDVMIWHFGYDGTVTPTDTPRPVPRTGDSGNPALWISLALLGLAGLAVSVLLKNPGKRK